MNTPIYATSYPGAIGYVFRLTGLGLPAAGVEVTKPLRVFTLNDFANFSLVPGQSYNVNVRVIFELDAPIGSYGKTCSITVPASGRMMEMPFDASAFPNPFNESFSISVQSHSSETITAKVYDMTGRLLESVKFDVSKGDEIPFGQTYPAGIYNVILSQGTDIKSLRVIKR
jgi:hypothetical protein